VSRRTLASFPEVGFVDDVVALKYWAFVMNITNDQHR